MIAAASRPFTVSADDPNHGYVIGSTLDLGYPRGDYDGL